MRKKISNGLSILWLLTGCMTIALYWLGQQTLQSANQRKTEILFPINLTVSESSFIEERNAQATFEDETIQPVTPDEYAEAQLQYEQIVTHMGIGSLYIPDASIYSPILAGLANEHLIVGVGTYRSTQQLGNGNYVLLSHNMMENGGKLGNLPKVSNGSILYATNFSDIFEYEVTFQAVIDASDTYFVEETQEGETPIMTLFRCEGNLNTDKRYMVQGTFKQSYSVNLADNDLLEKLGLIQRVENDPSETGNSVPSEEHPENTSVPSISKSSKNEPSKNNRWNTLERMSIRLYQLINQQPILFFLIYFIGFAICFFV